MHHRGRASPPPTVEVLDDLTVKLRSEDLAQLDPETAVHGLATGERLGCLGAPPGEVVATLAPPVAGELGQRRDHRPVFLLLIDPTQRQLPAHLRLHVAVMDAVTHRVEMQCATGTTRKIGSVQEDARVVDESCAPLLTAVLVLARLGVDAFLATLVAALPLVVGELLRGPDDVIAVFAIGEMGTIRAAPLDQLRRAFGQHPLTTASKDALPGGEQERGIDLPATTFFVWVIEADPLPIRTSHPSSWCAKA